MHIDWECPNCIEKHISRIEQIEVGDILSLKCSGCNTDVKFVVQRKKYILTCEQKNYKNPLKNAVAWE